MFLCPSILSKSTIKISKHVINTWWWLFLGPRGVDPSRTTDWDLPDVFLRVFFFEDRIYTNIQRLWILLWLLWRLVEFECRCLYPPWKLTWSPPTESYLKGDIRLEEKNVMFGIYVGFRGCTFHVFHVSLSRTHSKGTKQNRWNLKANTKVGSYIVNCYIAFRFIMFFGSYCWLIAKNYHQRIPNTIPPILQCVAPHIPEKKKLLTSFPTDRWFKPWPFYRWKSRFTIERVTFSP